MKKAFLMIALVAGMGLTTYAHEGSKTPEQRATHMTKKLSKKLNLTTAQSAKVKAILFEQATRMDSLKLKGTGGDRKENRLSKREIKMSTEQKLSAVLNADQMKNFEDWKAAHKKGHDKKHAEAVKQG